MNPTHFHLVITHLPIFGTILGGLILAYALWVKSNHTKIAAYMLLIISSAGAGVAYVTGEAAEETAEKIQGISENNIEQHEEFALITLVALITLGVISLIGLIITRRRLNINRKVAYITLFISLICFGLAGWTGFLGGKIRHTEGDAPISTVHPNF